MFTAVSKPLSSDMCTLVGRCLSFGPAASTIRAVVADQTGTLLFYTGHRWSGTEIQTGQWKPRPRKRPFLPLSFAPLLRLFPCIYGFPHPYTPLYNFRSPLENELFCRTHNPHWYSSVPDLPFPTIRQEENTWRHIPEERSFSLILSLHLISDLHSYSVPQCLAVHSLWQVCSIFPIHAKFLHSIIATIQMTIPLFMYLSLAHPYKYFIPTLSTSPISTRTS